MHAIAHMAVAAAIRTRSRRVRPHPWMASLTVRPISLKICLLMCSPPDTKKGPEPTAGSCPCEAPSQKKLNQFVRSGASTWFLLNGCPVAKSCRHADMSVLVGQAIVRTCKKPACMPVPTNDASPKTQGRQGWSECSRTSFVRPFLTGNLGIPRNPAIHSGVLAAPAT